MRDGKLPKDNDSVKVLAMHASEAGAAMDSGEMTLGRAALARWMFRPYKAGDLAGAVADEYAFWQLKLKRPVEDLSDDELALYSELHSALVVAVVPRVLLCSWPGICVYVVLATKTVVLGRRAAKKSGVAENKAPFMLQLCAVMQETVPALTYGMAMALVVPKLLAGRRGRASGR